MQDEEKSIDLTRLQEAARRLEPNAPGLDQHQKTALAAMRQRAAPAPELHPDGMRPKARMAMGSVDQDVAAVRAAARLERPIGPTERFNEQAKASPGPDPSAQAAALAALRERNPARDLDRSPEQGPEQDPVR